MSTTSMIDTAYEVLSQYKKPVAFQDLWGKVAKKMGYSEDLAKSKIASFYSKLSLDGRFVQDENRWTLKSKVKFEEKENDLDDYEEDEEDEDYEDEEDDSLDIPDYNNGKQDYE